MDRIEYSIQLWTAHEKASRDRNLGALPCNGKNFAFTLAARGYMQRVAISQAAGSIRQSDLHLGKSELGLEFHLDLDGALSAKEPPVGAPASANTASNRVGQ